jgi:hypothetical protein
MEVLDFGEPEELAGRPPLERLRAWQQRLDEQFGSSGDPLQQARDDMAGRARRGELGPEWQRLQQRIDLDQTTLDDVFSGRDDSADALAIAALSRRNAGAMRGEGDEWASAQFDAAIGELSEANAQLQRTMAALRERLRDSPWTT